MKKNTLTIYVSILFVLCTLIILSLNLMNSLQVKPSNHISPNDVRGTAVVFQGRPYTLNFSQQQFLLDQLNRSISYKEDPKEVPMSVEFENIIIYRFNEPEILIQPVKFLKENGIPQLVFISSVWNDAKPLQTRSTEDMSLWFTKTYDH